MEIGDIVETTVIRIEHYGIWLVVGNDIGLLMIPDISYKRVIHPSEYAGVGDVVTVKIIGFNTQKGQFVASRKVLHPEEQQTN